VRRLIALACSIVLVETTFFAALSPLLPRFAEELDLSKGESGLLVATYAIGGALGAIPSALVVTRFGVKATVILGLVLLTATSVAFGVVSSYWLLDLTRLAQGVAGALCWTGALAWLVDATPRERRGETIGIAMSAAVVGALLGPVVGAAAVHFGRAPTFGAVAALALLLALVALQTPAPAPEERQPLRVLLDALKERQVLVGMWLLTLPAILFGTLSVLGPLQLDALGWGAVGVAVTFVVSAAIEAVLNPAIGRWSDRRGRLAPMRVGLVASVGVALVIPWLDSRWTLSLFIVLAGMAFGTFWAPSMAMLSDGWEAAGVGHGLGFALMNLAWAPGHAVGSAVGGGIADAASDALAYGLLAALCLATLLALQGAFRRPVTAIRAAGRS
jgi:predicted MFS family arabinose efflux permease